MIKEKNKDRDLVKRILGGQTQLFGIIISDTERLVISIIYKMIKVPEDRKDLTQEVYLKVYSKLASFNFKSKLSTWIGTIAYNSCVNYLTKKKIPISRVIGDKKEHWESVESLYISSSDTNTERILLQKERSKIITSEINKLQPQFRTILTLFHKQELSYKEIAIITGLPEGTLKSYLFRARKQLKLNLLQNYKKEDL